MCDTLCIFTWLSIICRLPVVVVARVCLYGIFCSRKSSCCLLLCSRFSSRDALGRYQSSGRGFIVELNLTVCSPLVLLCRPSRLVVFRIRISYKILCFSLSILFLSSQASGWNRIWAPIVWCDYFWSNHCVTLLSLSCEVLAHLLLSLAVSGWMCLTSLVVPSLFNSVRWQCGINEFSFLAIIVSRCFSSFFDLFAVIYSSGAIFWFWLDCQIKQWIDGCAWCSLLYCRKKPLQTKSRYNSVLQFCLLHLLLILYTYGVWSIRLFLIIRLRNCCTIDRLFFTSSSLHDWIGKETSPFIHSFLLLLLLLNIFGAFSLWHKVSAFNGRMDRFDFKFNRPFSFYN